MILNDLEIDYKITDEKAATIFIILTDMKVPGKWIDATNFRHTINNDRSTDPETNDNFHAIMKEAESEYNYQYFNFREEIRRKCLHQFFEQGLILYNDDKPDRKPNSSLNNYRINHEVVKGLKLYGTNNWDKFVEEFNEMKDEIYQQYHRKRSKRKIPVSLVNSEGKDIEISIAPGAHSLLEKHIVEDFVQTKFVNEPVILYVDNTGRGKYTDKKLAKRLNLDLYQHGKLPDVIIFDADPQREWLLLFEAVSTHGPINETRLRQLYDLFSDHTDKLVFISVFQTLDDFKKFANDLAFDTEVWIAELPLHMIHFNGDRFFGPRKLEEK